MAKPKYNYVVNTPYGTFKRSSNKVYTHAVVSVGECFPVDTRVEQIWKRLKLCEYCGRLDLAQKLNAKYKKGKTPWGPIFRGESHIYEVEQINDE